MPDFATITFILTILAVIAAFVVPVAVSLWERKIKLLSCEFIAAVPLVSVQDDAKGAIQILFDGKPVPSVDLYLLKVVNLGNEAVDINDYRIPVTIKFADKDSILKAEIIECNPGTLPASIAVKDEKIELSPILFNPGYSITLKAFINPGIADETYTVRIDGLIVGGEIGVSISKRRRVSLYSVLGLILGLILGIALLNLSNNASNTPTGIVMASHDPVLFWFSRIISLVFSLLLPVIGIVVGRWLGKGENTSVEFVPRIKIKTGKH